MINTYYIGGSPCAGKSTVAEILKVGLEKKYQTAMVWCFFI